MIRITSKQDGFRRCGIAHTKTATEHYDDAFTPDQIEVLKEEPMLVVEIINEGQKEGGEKTGKKKGEADSK